MVPKERLLPSLFLQKQLRGLFLPGACVAWLCHMCVVLTFLSQPFTWVFLLWEKGGDDKILLGPLWPGSAGLF